MAYVYRHVRLDMNVPFYIGIGSDNKYKRAFDSIGRSNYWKRIVNKTDYRVDIIIDDLTYEEVLEKEKEFIELYGRADLNKGFLCNLTFGGEGASGVIRSKEWRDNKSKEMIGKFIGEKNPFYGKKHSNETIFKISEKRKGKSLTDETKHKMSLKLKGKFIGEKNPMFGKSMSDETKRKISESLKGRIGYWSGKKHSKETKEKIGKSGIGKKHSMDSIKKMSDAQKGKVFSLEHRLNLSKAKSNISDETRKKMSDAQKGKKRSPHTEETKRKISEGNKGKVFSQEVRKKMADSKKYLSDESRKRMSDAQKGKKRSPHTEERKRKISEGNKGKTRNKK